MHERAPGHASDRRFAAKRPFLSRIPGARAPGYILSPLRGWRFIALAFVAFAVIAIHPPASACHFCAPAATTLSQDIDACDVAVIATLTDRGRPIKPGGEEWTKAQFRIERVIRGEQILSQAVWGADVGEPDVETHYFGDKAVGTQFLILASCDQALNVDWLTPLALNAATLNYVPQLPGLPKQGPARLAFFLPYLRDADELLAADAHQEFEAAAYRGIQALEPLLNRKSLIAWIKDPRIKRKRLYLLMLSVCGAQADLPVLEKLLTAAPEKNEPRPGLEAAMVAYVMLRGEAGLQRIESLFLANNKAEYADTYSAVMAIRFLDAAQDKMPRQRLLASLRLMLDRPEYADLVIPDLIRWKDWSVMDRLVTLFKESDVDDEECWVRIPVIQYLFACPLPAAKKHLVELKKIDAHAVERASFILPLQARE